MIRKILNIVFIVLRFLLLLALLTLLFVHFILKDRFYSLSLLYYACPLPLLIIFGIAITFLFFGRKRIFYALALLLTGLLIYFSTHYFGTPVSPEKKEAIAKVVFWNMAQNKPIPTQILIKTITDEQPEIIGLVEALPSEEDLQTLKKACPNYEFRKLYGTTLVGVKGTIDDVEFKAQPNVYKFNYITATVNGKHLRAVIADVNAVPFSNKKFPLGTINEFSKENDVDIIMGDFNTPYESVFFKEYKHNFKSFHPYSIGMTSTWPTPTPVIEIDQIWIRKSFQPLQLRKACFKVSDHKMLIAEYQ